MREPNAWFVFWKNCILKLFFSSMLHSQMPLGTEYVEANLSIPIEHLKRAPQMPPQKKTPPIPLFYVEIAYFTVPPPPPQFFTANGNPCQTGFRVSKIGESITSKAYWLKAYWLATPLATQRKINSIPIRANKKYPTPSWLPDRPLPNKSAGTACRQVVCT